MRKRIVSPTILVCEATHARLCENRTVIIKIEAVFPHRRLSLLFVDHLDVSGTSVAGSSSWILSTLLKTTCKHTSVPHYINILYLTNILYTPQTAIISDS